MGNDSLSLVQQAIADCDVLALNYRSGNGTMSKRDIEPLALYFTQAHWMMIAYCRLREAQREFRLDGIIEIKKTGDSFPPNQFRLSDYFEK